VGGVKDVGNVTQGIRGVKVQARRQAIATTASEMILRRGFEGMSVNALADELGMSVGGLYRYISQKSDLLVMACEDIYGGVPTKIARAAMSEGTMGERLQRTLETYFESCRSNRDQILLMYREYRHLPPQAQVEYQNRELAIAGTFQTLIEQEAVEGDIGMIDPAAASLHIVFLGHLPALKSWALPLGEMTSESISAQVQFVLQSLRIDRATRAAIPSAATEDSDQGSA
jgi:AcrR family transcriptional regulator